MRTGLNNEHRIKHELCSKLDLPSTATDMQIVEALVKYAERIEKRMDHLEFLLGTDGRDEI